MSSVSFGFLSSAAVVSILPGFGTTLVGACWSTFGLSDLEDENNILSRNVRHQSPTDAAPQPKKKRRFLFKSRYLKNLCKVYLFIFFML
jgi:hypothetical protein